MTEKPEWAKIGSKVLIRYVRSYGRNDDLVEVEVVRHTATRIVVKGRGGERFFYLPKWGGTDMWAEVGTSQSWHSVYLMDPNSDRAKHLRRSADRDTLTARTAGVAGKLNRQSTSKEIFEAIDTLQSIASELRNYEIEEEKI